MANPVIDSFTVFWITIAVLIAWLLRLYVFRARRFFQRHGVKYEVGVPVFGTFVDAIFRNELWMDTLRKIYYKHPNEQIVGLSEIGGDPSLMIRDPELIHQVLVTDFGSFVNRYYEVNHRTDPLIGHELTNLKTDNWRRVRNTLTPLFTSLKFKETLVPSLVESKTNLVAYLGERMSGEETITVDVQELSTKSGIESFALAALGVKLDSLRGNDEGFHSFLESFLQYKDKSGMEYYSILNFPLIMKNALNRTLVKQEDDTYFKQMLRSVADSRSAKGIQRSDYLQLLQSYRGDKAIHTSGKHFSSNMFTNGLKSKIFQMIPGCTEDELVSQSFEFIESVVTENNVLIAFIMKHLATRAEIQHRLFDEFNAIKVELDGESLKYDSLSKMKYLEMVINEGLRMCPIATELHRRATKQSTLNGKNGVSVPIKPGTAIWIPIYTIHMDEKHFENATEFRPDRFSEENKKRIARGTYAPFGIGPRDCIGCRYTVAELKVFFYFICLNFHIEPSASTNETEVKLRHRLS